MLKKSLACFMIMMLLVGCNDDDEDSVSTAVHSSNADIAGHIQIAHNTATDNDINDVRTAALLQNNSIYQAQHIPNPVILGGYVNKPGSGPAGNFHEIGDSDDFFELDLRAGQVISLFVANENLSGNDLDLALLDSSGVVLNASISEGATESLVVPKNGHYFVQVRAFIGASNYILSIGQDTSTHATGLRLSDDFLPGELIVEFESESAWQAQSTLDSLGLKSNYQDPSRRQLVSLEPQQSRLLTTTDMQFATPELEAKYHTLMAVKQLRQRPDIAEASPNYLLQALRTPNDNLYRHQWNYPLMNLPLAWDTTVGSGSVVVAVIDTGVLKDHPDLQGKLTQGYDFIRNIRIALDGDGLDNNPEDPGDQSPNGSTFHGSHVAGIIAARSNNREGIAGIGWNTRVMPLRVLGKGGSGSDYDIEQAIRFAAGLSNDSGTLPPKPADIINLSLGGPTVSRGFQKLIDEVRQAGVMVVAAAGNDGTRTPIYPASLAGVISVSAVTIDKKRATYANYGPQIDIAAPGGDNLADLNGDGLPDSILSTIGDEVGGLPNKQTIAFKFGYSVGTSMAAPHVAGVLALMKAVNPQLTLLDFERLLKKDKLTDDLGTRGHDDQFGYGLINAHKAVLAALELTSGSVVEAEPYLVVSPTALNFGLSNTNATLTLNNGGSGHLRIEAIRENSGGFLSIDGNGLGNYSVTADRSRLSPGTFTATITITTNSTLTPQVTLPVILQVGDSRITGNAGLHYILLIDPESLETIEEARAVASQGRYQFEFNNIAPGDYIIVAGSDINNDHYICDLGEACGAYLTVARPTTVHFSGRPAHNIDFNTGFNVNFAAKSITAMHDFRPPAQGFARLNKKLNVK